MHRKISQAVLLILLISAHAQITDQPTAPKLNYEAVPNFFQLPQGENFVEPAGVAVNSKGHIYLFHRGKHPNSRPEVRFEVSRVAARAGMPIATPASTRKNPSRSIIQSTSARSAPKAMGMLISLSRSDAQV
jgi:hypothetical protein